jgi:hypothetical protein
MKTIALFALLMGSWSPLFTRGTDERTAWMGITVDKCARRGGIPTLSYGFGQNSVTCRERNGKTTVYTR